MKNLKTRTVICDSGSSYRSSGEEELNSRGVSYCAVCDGAFSVTEICWLQVVVTQRLEAVFLTQFAKTVTIVHQIVMSSDAQKVLQDRAFANEKINFILGFCCQRSKGENGSVESVVIENVKTNQVTEHASGGVFIYVGLDHS